MTVNILLISTVIFGAWADAALAQDLTAGEAAFRKCQVCHDVGESARNKLGPALNGLDGRKAGIAQGYDYSKANKNSGIVWTEACLKQFGTDEKKK